MSVRNKKKKKFAEYILQYEPGVPLAIVEVQTMQNQMASAVDEQALSTKANENACYTINE